MFKGQEVFKDVYLGRTSVLFEWSYMRSSKNLRLHRRLRQQGISLENATICDIGFGSGSFLRKCPKSSRLCGVEIEEATVLQANALLKTKGFPFVDLHTFSPGTPLDTYFTPGSIDVLVISHVLEHVPDPVGLLNEFFSLLRPGGVLVGLLPINEKRDNPHHLWKVTPELFQEWVNDLPLETMHVQEVDVLGHLLYSIGHYESGFRYGIAQAVRFLIGFCYCMLPDGFWSVWDLHLNGRGGLRCAQLQFLMLKRVEKRP